MSGAAKVNKGELLELARALGDELVDEEETVSCIFARCLERARELGRPVELYALRTHPVVAEWARLVLDDARRYERDQRAALAAWEVKPTTQTMDPQVAATMRERWKSDIADDRERLKWIAIHIERAAHIETEEDRELAAEEDEHAAREQARRQDERVNHCLHRGHDGDAPECPDCGQSRASIADELLTPWMRGALAAMRSVKEPDEEGNATRGSGSRS